MEDRVKRVLEIKLRAKAYRIELLRILLNEFEADFNLLGHSEEIEEVIVKFISEANRII